MTTHFPEDPFKTVITWQAKFKEYKQKCGVAEMDTPQVTKESRENLHNTANAADSVKDWRSFWTDVLDEKDSFKQPVLNTTKQQTIDNFLDTICCALEELSGEEVFECFVKAVQNQFEYTKKEHDKINALFNLLIKSK